MSISSPLSLTGQLHHGHRPPHRGAGVISLTAWIIPVTGSPFKINIALWPRYWAKRQRLASEGSVISMVCIWRSNGVAVRGTGPRPLIGYRLKVNDICRDNPAAEGAEFCGRPGDRDDPADPGQQLHLYSINLSALASSDGGTVRPSDFAEQRRFWATSPLPDSGKRCTGTAARDFTLLRLIDLQLFENVAFTLDRRRDHRLCKVED